MLWVHHHRATLTRDRHGRRGRGTQSVDRTGEGGPRAASSGLTAAASLGARRPSDDAHPAPPPHQPGTRRADAPTRWLGRAPGAGANRGAAGRGVSRRTARDAQYPPGRYRRSDPGRSTERAGASLAPSHAPDSSSAFTRRDRGDRARPDPPQGIPRQTVDSYRHHAPVARFVGASLRLSARRSSRHGQATPAASTRAVMCERIRALALPAPTGPLPLVPGGPRRKLRSRRLPTGATGTSSPTSAADVFEGARQRARGSLDAMWVGPSRRVPRFRRAAAACV